MTALNPTTERFREYLTSQMPGTTEPVTLRLIVDIFDDFMSVLLSEEEPEAVEIKAAMEIAINVLRATGDLPAAQHYSEVLARFMERDHA